MGCYCAGERFLLKYLKITLFREREIENDLANMIRLNAAK